MQQKEMSMQIIENFFLIFYIVEMHKYLWMNLNPLQNCIFFYLITFNIFCANF